MIVELLTLGDELLDGRRIDTNTAWLGRRLTALGAPPRFRQTTSDRLEDISAAFILALSRADVVLSTGGLGPTSDDLTFEGVAAAMGKGLTFLPDIYARIQKRFEDRGLRCPESNRRQALLPEGSVEIRNDWGTAPGIQLDVGEKVIFSLPGVPSEMMNLFDRGVLPEIERRMGLTYTRKEKIFKFAGIPESHLEERVDALRFHEIAGAEIRIAYTAGFPQIDLTLSVVAKKPGEGEVAMNEAICRVRRDLGEFLIAEDDETLEGRAIEVCQAKGWKLGVAESLTGGLITQLLVSIPGASHVLDRAVVAYSNVSKEQMLGVMPQTLQKFGAVSEECALEMARGCRARFGVDVGMSSTGIAGPEGGTPEKPVGLTYLAWTGPGFEEVRKFQFRWDRNRNRMLAAVEALRGLLHIAQRSNPKEKEL